MIGSLIEERKYPVLKSYYQLEKFKHLWMLIYPKNNFESHVTILCHKILSKQMF